MRQNKLRIGRNMPGNFESVELMQSFNNKEIRRKGITFTTVVGGNTIPVQLPGLAKLLVGIIIFDDSGNPGNLYSLTVNGDKKIDAVSLYSLSRAVVAGGVVAGIFSNKEYFPVMCPLSGNDTIEYECNAALGGTAYTTFFYVNEPEL